MPNQTRFASLALGLGLVVACRGEEGAEPNALGGRKGVAGGGSGLAGDAPSAGAGHSGGVGFGGVGFGASGGGGGASAGFTAGGGAAGSFASGGAGAGGFAANAGGGAAGANPSAGGASVAGGRSSGGAAASGASAGGKASGGAGAGGKAAGGATTGGAGTAGTAAGGVPTGGKAAGGGTASGGSSCSTASGSADAVVSIDTNQAIRTIPDDLYGWNSTIWSGGEQNGSSLAYNALLRNAGFKVMRWPGGSWGDSTAWNQTQCGGSWIVSYAQSKALFQSLGIKFQPIVNFSGYWCAAQHSASDSNLLAADWARDGALGATYWEVGNELMGHWEQGHTVGADYGARFADFYSAMKAVNANIQIIAVGDQNDAPDSFNPGTGVWTRELLKAARAKGVVPDGFQIHNYPGNGGNVQLLHGDLDAIGKWTASLNTMVSQETGKGQLAYCMTEFGAAGNDRWLKMIGAQLALQYVMEMAKNKWAAANIFGELYNTTTYAAAPVWYVYALLHGKFGRDLVASSSTNADVRGYAASNGNDLTLWLANNATAARTIRVNLSGFKPACSGSKWILEGANGGGEEAYDVAINGVVHPTESSVRDMPGVELPAGTSFDVSLPKSSLGLIVLKQAAP